MKRIVRLVLLLAVLLFALVLVLCPKTAMAEDPVRIAPDSHKSSCWKMTGSRRLRSVAVPWR